MELDKTKIYSLEGMNLEEVKEFFKKHRIELTPHVAFIRGFLAKNDDVIGSTEFGYQWILRESEDGREIVKVKDL